jgi:hypothetical protein
MHAASTVLLHRTIIDTVAVTKPAYHALQSRNQANKSHTVAAAQQQQQQQHLQASISVARPRSQKRDSMSVTINEAENRMTECKFMQMRA